MEITVYEILAETCMDLVEEWELGMQLKRLYSEKNKPYCILCFWYGKSILQVEKEVDGDIAVTPSSLQA